MEISDHGGEIKTHPSIKSEKPTMDASVMNGDANGLTNGHGEKDRSKDRHRDKDKHKHHDKHSSSKDKHSSSSSSSKDKHRDKDKERNKERSKDHSRDKKDKERSDKDKERSDKDKERSDKDKNRSEKDKERSKDKHKDDKSRHSGSSSSSKDPNKSSSGIKSSSSSSSSKDKDRSKPNESPDKKHSSEHRSKDHKSSSKDKDRKPHGGEKTEPPKVKEASPVKVKVEQVKQEPMESDDDDVPLMDRNRKRKGSSGEDSDEDIPLMQRKKVKVEKETKRRNKAADSDEEEDFKPAKAAKKKKKPESQNSSTTESPKKGGRKKKEEEEREVWKWWEEEKANDGKKWNYLEHKGPVFAPPYERLPDGVKFKYDGKTMKLSVAAEEVATFYARMIEHDYTTKEEFNDNFFKDWRKVMTTEEKNTIIDLSKCDFKPMHAYFQLKSEERKAMTKEEKNKIKEENAAVQAIYGVAIVDGHKEKIGNYKIEPPGLFRGRGEHPKMGKLKKRVMPEDVIINCSKDAPVPKPPAGHKWKEVRHDNEVTWLASWTENVQGQVKYVMLNPSSKLKGEKDMQKYETARKLHKRIGKIREEYRQDWKHKEMRIRQRSVALYFIDKLALRAGNEKDEDQADTVGCCSLRVEHIALHDEKDGKQYVVVFDFLGKDSIRYYNEIEVEKRVFKNLQLFLQGKNKGDDLFDRLNTSILNKHLNDLMEGLTAKVFRTYNASITLQQQLIAMTDENSNLPEKMLTYNRANRAVAILCNHQRSVPKTHEKSMENLRVKIDAKKQAVQDAEEALSDAKKEYKRNKSEREKMNVDKKKKALERTTAQLKKLEVQATDREENKEIALGTSKLNYLDPRISIAWCKKYDVPIDKIYNKTQREKFNWAIDMAGPDYIF